MFKIIWQLFMQREVLTKFHCLILKTRPDIFKAKFLKIQFFIVVTPCSLVNSYSHFEGWFWLLYQSHVVQKEK
jgi:hypothetical protein